MTEQQQKLLQEAKDAVAKEHLMYSESVWDDVLSPDKLKLIESVAIKYNELCEADKWISVDEKEPEDLQSIIVKNDSFIIKGGFYKSTGKFCNDGFGVLGIKVSCTDLDNFTHWKPSPK